MAHLTKSDGGKGRHDSAPLLCVVRARSGAERIEARSCGDAESRSLGAVEPRNEVVKHVKVPLAVSVVHHLAVMIVMTVRK
jgi:hypothetical protein